MFFEPHLFKGDDIMYRSETLKSDGQMAGSRRGVSQGQCRHVARRQGRDDDDNVPVFGSRTSSVFHPQLDF